MKESLLIFFLGTFLGIQVVVAQQAAIETSLDIDAYPEISFTFRDYSRESLSLNDVVITEDARPCDKLRIEEIPQGLENKYRHILVLWENMGFYNRGGMFSATQDILRDFVAQSSEKNRVAIATYNRTYNGPALHFVTKDFLSEKETLATAIDGIRASTKSYPSANESANIFEAVSEGVDFLVNSGDDVAKAIIVFTGGRPVSKTGSGTENNAIRRAINARIPVYVCQFYEAHGETASLNDLVECTRGGKSRYATNKSSASSIIGDLNVFCSNVPALFYGHLYKISFATNTSRGGKSSVIGVGLVHNGNVQSLHEFSLNPPKHTLSTWIKVNLFLFIVLCVAVVGCGVMVSALFHKYKESRLRVEKDLLEAQSVNEDLARDVSKMQREIRDVAEARQLEEMKAEQRREEEKARLLVEKEKKLYELMYSRNLRPRLSYVLNGVSNTFEMKKTSIFIGRGEGNDLNLPDNSISRKHVRVFYDSNEGFLIEDLGSTNGTSLNGKHPFKSGVFALSNGDVITLGPIEIVFTI